MKIGYFGDGPWSHAALERILAQPGLEISFIAARYENPDPVLRDWAERLDVPFLTPVDVNAAEFLAWLGDRGVDVNVSMSFNQILRLPIIGLAPKGFINCHAGALPFYRGRNILNWAIINGETRFGVTVHHVDKGIDTGDIILQRFADIDPEDDYASVLVKAHVLCADVLSDALVQIANGSAQRIPQSSIHPVGFYCGRRRPGDEAIDWRWPSKRVHDFIRAITLPGPGARAVMDGRTLAILRSETITGAPAYLGTEGEVVGRDENGIVIKTGDTTLRITHVAPISADGRVGESEIPKFPIGRRFDLAASGRIPS